MFKNLKKQKNLLAGLASALYLLSNPISANGCSYQTALFRENFGGSELHLEEKETDVPSGAVDGLVRNDDLLDGNNNYRISQTALPLSDPNASAHVYNGWYSDFTDHTGYAEEYLSDGGHFMQIYQRASNATYYSKRLDNLCANSSLSFSFWAFPVDATNDTPVLMTVEDKKGNVLFEKKISINHTSYKWQQFNLKFDVPAGVDDLTFNLKSADNTSTHAFAIDDIEIKICKSAPIIVSEQLVCVGYPTELMIYYINPDGYTEPVSYTWYFNPKSSYELTGWTKVGSGEKLSFSKFKNTDSGFYKVVVSDAGKEGKIDRCNSASDYEQMIGLPCDCDGSDTTFIEETICSSETYSDNNFNIVGSSPGVTTHSVSLLNEHGCDSVVVLNLTTNQSTTEELFYTIASGDSVVLNDKVYKKSGLYFQMVDQETCEALKIEVKVESFCDQLEELRPAAALVLAEGSERWHIEGIDQFPDTKVRIFDRSGRLLWEGKEYNDQTGWDGTYQGNPLPTTDYWYTINSEKCDRMIVGHLTLMRRKN